MVGQIAGTGTVHKSTRPDGPDHQTAGLGGSDPQGKVHAFVHQVDDPIAGAELQLDLGLIGKKPWQRRCYVPTRDAAGHVHAQAPAQGPRPGPQLLLQLLHIGHQGLGALQE